MGALLTSGFSLEELNTFPVKIHRMFKLGLTFKDDATDELDVDMPPLENKDAYN